MQAHAGVGAIDIDQAGLRRVRIARELPPGSEQHVRDWWPGRAGLRMRGLIAVAALVRHPTERAAIGHPHRHRLAALGHPGRVDRGGAHDLAQRGDHRLLGGAVEITSAYTQASGHEKTSPGSSKGPEANVGWHPTMTTHPICNCLREVLT